MRVKNQRARGTKAEQQAIDYLVKQGLKLIMKNFYSYSGEIDLIMNDGEFIAFVEVRQRNNRAYGDGVASVGYQKQQKLIKTAHYFLLKHQQYANYPCRFDIVALSNTRIPPLEWVKDAFRAG